MMFHADAATVHAALDWRGTVAALRAAHAEDAMPLSDTRITDEPGGGPNQFVNLAAWAPARAIAVKLVGVFPGNPGLATPEPSVQGLVALFDGATGRALMTCDGAALTYRKTAADSALGCDLLARQDAEVLVLAGAGGLAPYVAEAHCAVRPSIRRIAIWNRRRARAEALAETLRRLGRSVDVVDDLETALPAADIVSSVTMAAEPIITGRALKPGAHVDLVGAYLPAMREADDEVMHRAGKLFVDTRRGCEGSGDVAGPLASGAIARKDIVADYFDLCTGRHPGRRSRDEITVCKNVGGGHLDLYVALHLYHTAFGARRCVQPGT